MFSSTCRASDEANIFHETSHATRAGSMSKVRTCHNSRGQSSTMIMSPFITRDSGEKSSLSTASVARKIQIEVNQRGKSHSLRAQRGNPDVDNVSDDVNPHAALIEM